MPTEWSDNILLADLSDEPQLSEEFSEIFGRLSAEGASPNLVLNLASVSYLNSSHLAQLLRMRKRLVELERTMILCALRDEVWSVMMLTGLEKLFQFAPDTMTALATLQIEGDEDPD